MKKVVEYTVKEIDHVIDCFKLGYGNPDLCTMPKCRETALCNVLAKHFKVVKHG